ncbi:NAD(P)-dependent oxidoreductase [Bradyrhizobium niftali]|uniref:NAD(P)-dependent oxidoreductase n=1 Tax=Bradyrhizobium niftali TaxID=2560055 RepID=UPI0024C05BE6|nr:NAD(P)-dependent oxidoreductase [Bradyrhizobium niftali]
MALPGTPETVGAIGADEIACMRSNAFLINIARGFVLVESELIKALQTGAIAGAMLDVFEKEPLPQDSPLWYLPNVIVTPHSAGFPENYAGRVFSVFADNIDRYLQGQPLKNVVNMSRGY